MCNKNKILSKDIKTKGVFFFFFFFFFLKILCENLNPVNNYDNTNLGPVVQSIVSLTSSLRGQLVKCFMTL